MDSLASFTFPFTSTAPSTTTTTRTSRPSSTPNPSTNPPPSPRKSPSHRRSASITSVASTLNYIPPVPAIPAAYRTSSNAAAAAALTPKRGGGAHAHATSSSRYYYSPSAPPSARAVHVPTPAMPRAVPGRGAVVHRRQSTDSVATSSSRASCSSGGCGSLMAGVAEERDEEGLGLGEPEEEEERDGDEDEEEFWGCAGLVGGYDLVVGRRELEGVAMRGWDVA